MLNIQSKNLKLRITYLWQINKKIYLKDKVE